MAAIGEVSASHLSRIENGERAVSPATVALYQRAVNEALGEAASPTFSAVRRKDFLALAGATVAGAVAAGPATGPDADECADWLAWETWTAGRDLHETEIPADRRPGLSLLVRRRRVVRTAAGLIRFPHPGLVDFHIGRRVFDGVAAGSSATLETAQTTHATDLVIREFVEHDPRAVAALNRWMTDGGTDVLRVNAAGILAKVAAPDIADRVIAALRVDSAARTLYLTAVASRVLAMPWDAATKLASGTQAPPHDSATRLSGELRNPRDAAARWCSAVLLHQTGEAAAEPVKAAVADALRTEASPENLRTMAALLAGADPITTTNGRRP
ncbi:hypothetical protein [Asanoa siamensis]|uniref:Helix-turn-helix protein n=1 Tax=Asanoa siamensis TaxID=926357 RepID=A0ABQ4CXF9_9ACTN|nr:hypothetical protein [Asanoa siamensis]GIF75972.1 hypothetical protein Asi02nite_54900 [Asanoa siamensis]